MNIFRLKKNGTWKNATLNNKMAILFRVDENLGVFLSQPHCHDPCHTFKQQCCACFVDSFARKKDTRLQYAARVPNTQLE